jgi:hypothetical protein
MQLSSYNDYVHLRNASFRDGSMSIARNRKEPKSAKHSSNILYGLSEKLAQTMQEAWSAWPQRRRMQNAPFKR